MDAIPSRLDFSKRTSPFRKPSAFSPAAQSTAYGLIRTLVRVQGPAVGVRLQKAFKKLGRLGKVTWYKSAPPSDVVSSWSTPSLPAIAMVPPSMLISALSGVALFNNWIPPVVAPATKL